MKYLIIGLGNIGLEYNDTRHNAGFDILDYYLHEKGGEWNNERYGDLAEVKMKGRTIYLLKPSTYMNRSGQALRYWQQRLKIDDQNILVIYDDLYLDFGAIRMRQKGSDGGHNGIKDIIEKLGHQNFSRIRFGIGNQFGRGNQVDYVLGKWTKEELDSLIEYFPYCGKMIDSFILMGPAKTMSDFNKR